MTAKRVRVLISGLVQGVGFRYYCRDEAARRGLGGYVRNLPDGRVEASFEGEPGAVDAMVAWCRSGPRSARVSGVEVEGQALAGEREFRIAV